MVDVAAAFAAISFLDDKLEVKTLTGQQQWFTYVSQVLHAAVEALEIIVPQPRWQGPGEGLGMV